MERETLWFPGQGRVLREVLEEVLRQQHGISIGGMVSKCSCSVTLGMSEQIWSETWGKHFMGHLVTSKYVDDLVVMSPEKCRDCVQVLLKSVNPSGVEFEAQPGCDWLDMSLRFDREGELVVSAEQTVPDWVHGRVEREENTFHRFWEIPALILDVCGAGERACCQVATTQAATC